MTVRHLLLASIVGVLAAEIVAAQDSTTVRAVPTGVEAPQSKREGVAMLRGIIPGAGHFYAGERTRGTVLASAFVIGVGLMVLAQDEEWVCDPDIFLGEGCYYDWTAAYENRVHTGIALSLGSMVYSVVDARRAARRTNRRNGLAPARVTAVPHVVPSRRGSTMVGISLRSAW